jgi:hypothetical protein
MRGWRTFTEKRHDAQMISPRSLPEPDAILFGRLVRQWKKDTISISSIEEMALHPAYQRIIGMGPAALPWIFKELEAEPDYWFWALRAITGDDPVKPSERGRITDMTKAWLDWAEAHGIR